ncbi:collagen alpha-1(I) chain-like [Scylla paramamosain]|uniref:collagen alpha-1(I) chain-like n=1 Tax=Scylla paramamosain TaxID=85552 RepID=UPI003083DF78
MRAPVLLQMWRRRWPTNAAPVFMVMVAVLSSLPVTLTAPTEDSLEDTARVLGHFSAGVGTRRNGAPSRSFTGISQGSLRGQQPFQVRLDSLEVNDNSREVPSRPGQHGDDRPSLERESLEVTLGSSAVPASGTSGSHGFSSQYFVVEDDDSFEIDEDDFRFMNLGRRYHPDGISPVSPQQLFIPQPAIPPTSSLVAPASRNLGPSLNNPYIIATASSSEEIDEDNPYEDDDDDEDLAMYLSKNLLTVKGDDSSEERLELDDALLGRRYNFIDGQGSHRWGYDLVDQYQHQTVNTDGTMDGRFGWTAPNGQEIRVQYVADDGGYRLVGSSGIHPADSEDVHRLKIEHSQIYKEVASRPPVAPLPVSPGVPLPPVSHGVHLSSGSHGVPLSPVSHAVHPSSVSPGVPLPPVSPPSSGSPGVPLSPTDKSYKVTIPFGGIGVPLPDPHRDRSPFQGSPGFSLGVPLPPPHDSSGTVGVPLPTQTGAGSEGASFSIPSGQPTGGVPLPSPSGPGAKPSRPGFFDEGEEVIAFSGGTMGVPLPTQNGAGSGVSFSIPPRQPTGGVPLPSPSGPGARPSRPGLSRDDDTVVFGESGGVGLPGISGFETTGVSLSSPSVPMTGGVPLPSPSGPPGAPSGTGFFGDDETVVVGIGGGVGLPGAPGVSLSSPAGPVTGGVPLPSPSGPPGPPSGPGFFGDDDTVVGGGGVALPGAPGVSLSSPVGPAAGGVPLPSPSGPPGPPSGPGFFGDDDTVVAGGGVGLPGAPGVSLSSPVGPATGGVPLPSPSGPPGTPSGPGFFGDDTVVAGGGVGLPGAPGVSLSSPVGPATGGVPLPSPSGPPGPPSRPGFFGDDDTVVAGGGVGLPGAPGVSLSSPIGPATGGVPLPSPSGPPGPPSGPGFFGDDDTVVAGDGVGLPGVPGVSLSSPVGPATGGVPLPSPSGPPGPPSGPGFFGDDDTVVAGDGVGLPGTPGISLSSPIGPATGGVPLPSPSGPPGAPTGPAFFGDDDTVVAESGIGLPGAPGVSLSSPVGPVTGGVPLPSPSGPPGPPSGLGVFGDDDAIVAGETGDGPGGTVVFGTRPVGTETDGVPLPSPSGPEPAPSGTGLLHDESVGFKGASGVGLPEIPGVRPGGIPLPSPSGPETAPSGPGFLGDDDTVVTGTAADVGTSGVSLSIPIGLGTGGVSLPSPSEPAAGQGFLDDDTAVAGDGIGLPGAPGISFSIPIGPDAGGVSLPSPSAPEPTPSVIFGDDDTVLTVSAAGPPEAPGVSLFSPVAPGAGGVPLPSPSGPESTSVDDTATGIPGFVDITSGFGAPGPGLQAAEPGIGAGAGVSLPGFGSPDDDAAVSPAFDFTTGFGASGPGLSATGPGTSGGAGVSLPGVGSLDDDTAGSPGFDSIGGFGTSGSGLPATGPATGDGAGVSLPGFGSPDDDAAGSPGFKLTTGFGTSETGLQATGPGIGAGSGVSLPEFGSSDDNGAVSPGFDFTAEFGASGPGIPTAGPGVSAGSGVSLPGFGSLDDDAAGSPGFDSSRGFGASGPGLPATGPGVSVGSGVLLPGFGSLDDDAAGSPGFDSSRGFGASGPGLPATGPGVSVGSGVLLPGFGSLDDDAAGSPGFDSSRGFGASRPGLPATGPGVSVGSGVSLPGFGSHDDDTAGRPGFDDSSSGFGLSSSGFNGEVPLSVLDSSDNGKPMSPDFGFSGAIGSSDDFGQSSGGFGFEGGVPLNSGFGGSASFNGRGALDASEVPLQGPPVSSTFSLSTNLGHGTVSSGVPLNTGKDLSSNKIRHSHGTSQFFEVGPPEPAHHAAGGPTSASPLPFYPHTPMFDSQHPNQFHSSSGPVREASPFAESSANLDSELEKPQDLVKIYHDIYGIKMRLEDWLVPKRREAPRAIL